MIEYIKRASAWTIAAGVTIWVAGISLFVFGPKLETLVLPVVDNVQAAPIRIDRDREILHIAAYGHTVRQCEWQGINALVFKDGIWHEGNIFRTDPRLDPSPGFKNDSGLFSPGLHPMGEIYVFPAGEKVKVYALHRCHPLWQTHTPLYELDFSKTPNQTR